MKRARKPTRPAKPAKAELLSIAGFAAPRKGRSVSDLLAYRRLAARVSDLEALVEKLKTRVAALEGAAGGSEEP